MCVGVVAFQIKYIYLLFLQTVIISSEISFKIQMYCALVAEWLYVIDVNERITTTYYYLVPSVLSNGDGSNCSQILYVDSQNR